MVEGKTMETSSWQQPKAATTAQGFIQPKRPQCGYDTKSAERRRGSVCSVGPKQSAISHSSPRPAFLLANPTILLLDEPTQQSVEPDKRSPAIIAALDAPLMPEPYDTVRLAIGRVLTTQAIGLRDPKHCRVTEHNGFAGGNW